MSYVGVFPANVPKFYSPSGGQVLSAEAVESIGLGDLIGRYAEISRMTENTVGLADGALRTGNLFRGSIAGVSALGLSRAIKSMFRGAPEEAVVLGVCGRRLDALRYLLDSSGVVDATSRLITLLREAEELSVLEEILGVVEGVRRAVIESLEVLSSVVGRVDVGRVVSNVISLAGVALRRVLLSREMRGSTSLSDAVLRLKNAVRFVGEELLVNEVAEVVKSLFRDALDVVSIVWSRVISVGKRVFEGIDVFDSVFLAKVMMVLEVLKVADVIRRGFSVVCNVVFVLSGVDRKRFGRVTEELVSVMGVSEYFVGVFMEVLESLRCLDVVSAVSDLRKIMVETLEIGVTAAKSAMKVLIERVYVVTNVLIPIVQEAIALTLVMFNKSLRLLLAGKELSAKLYKKFIKLFRE